MIVAMKKVTLLILDEDKESVLTVLRDLGVMQITQTTSASVTSVAAREQYEQAKKTIDALESFAAAENWEIPERESKRDGTAVLDEARKRLDDAAKLRLQMEELSCKIENLAVWGDFDRTQLEDIKSSGVNILLCRGTAADFKAAQAVENVECIEVSRIKKDVAFAVVSLDEINEKEFPAIKLAADDDPSALKKQFAQLSEQYETIKKNVDALLSVPKEQAQQRRHELE